MACLYLNDNPALSLSVYSVFCAALRCGRESFINLCLLSWKTNSRLILPFKMFPQHYNACILCFFLICPHWIPFCVQKSSISQFMHFLDIDIWASLASQINFQELDITISNNHRKFIFAVITVLLLLFYFVLFC